MILSRTIINPLTLLTLLSQVIASPDLWPPPQQPAQLHIRQAVNPTTPAAPSTGNNANNNNDNNNANNANNNANNNNNNPNNANNQANNNNNNANNANNNANNANNNANTGINAQNQGNRPAIGLITSPNPVATVSSYSPPFDSPAGGLTYTQPPATAAASYYKIAENNALTFGWNYTNILSYGNSITIAAFCSLNKITYTITTLSAMATALTWDPYAQQQSPGYPPFAVATYTMQIYDERGPSAGPTPGLLSPNSALKFAMYKPQPYTPLASWTCSTCSAAVSLSHYSPIILACTATLVTAIAGGWFGVLAGIR